MKMDKKEIKLPQPVPCNECPAGMMHARMITYFTWMGEELITVPHFPAWVCDMCGKREYDEKAIAWLNMLLNPNAGKPTPHRRRTPPPARPRPGSPRPVSDS
jgi:YgiT-type zinc finger domain-containing protein